MAWTPPAPLQDGLGRSYYAETPEVVRRGASVTLLGGPTFQIAGDGPGASDAPALLAGLRTRFDVRRGTLAVVGVLPLPGGLTRLSIPRAVAGRGDSLAVVWRDERKAAPGEREPVLTAVWDGHAWSVPKTLIQPDAGVPWIGSQVSNTARTETSGLVAAASLRYDSLYLLRGVPRGWTARAVRFPSSSYNQLVAGAAGDGATLVMAYVAAGGASRQNALFLSRSDNGGASWTPGSLLSAFEGGPVHFVHMANDGPRASLTWLEATPSRILLRLAVGDGAGRDWSLVAPFPLPEGETWVSAHAVTGGAPHLLMAANGASAATLWHVWWDGTRWDADTLAVLDGAVVPTPVLTALDANTALALWSVLRPGRPLPTTYYAIGRACD